MSATALVASADRSLRARTRSATESSHSLARFRNQQGCNKALSQSQDVLGKALHPFNQQDNAEDMFASKHLHARAKRPRTASDTAASHAFLAFLQGRTSGARSMGGCDVMSLDTEAATTHNYVTLLHARIRELEAALDSAQSQTTAHAARMATMQARLVSRPTQTP